MFNNSIKEVNLIETNWVLNNILKISKHHNLWPLLEVKE